MNKLKVIQVVSAILAACVLFAAIASAILSSKFIRYAKSTTGQIVAVNTELTDRGELYQPTFKFDVNGQNYSVTPTHMNTSTFPGNIGDEVSVLYDPLDPSKARINSYEYNWAPTAFAFTLAITLGSISLGLAWFRKRSRYAPPKAGEHRRGIESQ